MPTKAFLFLDTNILLHFRPTLEIPWRELVSADEIELVITGIVLKELDKQKNTHSVSKIRQRVRGVLKDIEGWAETREGYLLREGVRIRVDSTVPDIDFKANGLDRDWNDDYQLATILTLAGSGAREHFYYVSNDTAPRIKARERGFKAVELPEEFQLPAEPDPAVAEIARLRQENVRLARPNLPVLHVAFSDGGQFLKFAVPKLREPADVAADLEKELAALKARYAEREEPPIPPVIRLGLIGDRTLDGEIERYINELPKFFKRYEKFLHEKAELERRRTLVFSFELQIQNTGRAVAIDIDVHLHFPDGFVLSKADELSILPTEPEPPLPPQTISDTMRRSLASAIYTPSVLNLNRPSYARPIPPPANVSSIRITKGNSFKTATHVRSLKHGFTETLGKLALQYEKPEDIHSFEATYMIHAGTLPEPSTGSLNFVFDRT